MTVEKIPNVFNKIFNPLRMLTKPQIERMIDNYRHGDDVRLQLVFSQIETMSSIYQVCISKRTAGVVNRKWDILPIVDSPEAKAQAAKVKEMFLKADARNEDGLTEALKYLVLAAFRGRSAVKPFIEDGELILKKLNNWNLLQYNGNLYWNPSSEEVGWFYDNEKPPLVIPLPKDEVCCISNSMPIDIPGLMLYLRQLVGEEQWSRFVEKQGIPQVVINTPNGTPDNALDLWNQRALQIFEGGSGTLPYDAKINILDSARSQDPFTSYIQHQMEMVCILSLGGTLLAMPGATGLGSDLARVQQESFNSLVNQDCKLISNAMSSIVVKKCVQHLFGKNAKNLVRFTFVEDDEYGPEDYLNFAERAHSLGMKIDVSKLKELTKLSFIDDTEQTWTPEKEDKDWTPEEKAELRKEMEVAE